MSKVIKIKKGLNIPLVGQAEKILAKAEKSQTYAIRPTDFHGLTPKLKVKVDDKVKKGTPLFYDKYRQEIQFVSPVSGIVSAINRGERRRILEVVITPDGNNEAESFDTGNYEALSSDELIKMLQSAGLWPFVRQRPYDVIANPNEKPKAIFISGFNTAPLAPDYDFVLNGEEDAFQAGVNVLSKLTEGKVHLNVSDAFPVSPLYQKTEKVQLNKFAGKHPAGNVGVQIHYINPILKGDVIWYVNPLDVVQIGKFFMNGELDFSRIVVVAGSEANEPRYFRTHIGSSIKSIVGNNVKKENEVRYVSGNPLTGSKENEETYLGFYDAQISLIPEGRHSEFLGWAMPGLNKFSLSHTFLSWLTPSKKYALNTNFNGGERAFVMSGEYEKVFPFEILPVQLLKAVLAEDIEAMEALGIYEVAPEDFALCEFVCTSKIESQEIVRKGLDLMIKEMS